jgi:hypothetical protein
MVGGGNDAVHGPVATFASPTRSSAVAPPPLPLFVAAAQADVRGRRVAVHFRDERGFAILARAGRRLANPCTRPPPSRYHTACGGTRRCSRLIGTRRSSPGPFVARAVGENRWAGTRFQMPKSRRPRCSRRVRPVLACSSGGSRLPSPSKQIRNWPKGLTRTCHSALAQPVSMAASVLRLGRTISRGGPPVCSP